ncbi:hypothetical protein [Nitrosomonas sp. ANs5]|uniref:hypothetical protein n=1 Tax=Nitrosomonas sp. ANs5 TaxID=3423941 RepID=UPI003D333344
MKFTLPGFARSRSITTVFTFLLFQNAWAGASQAADAAIELERMEIHGEIIRPNMTGILPELGGINDAAMLLQRVPGGNVSGLGPLSGIAQYRGMCGDRINVDFKGMNYKSACANAMDAPLSHVPAAMTSLLKVNRGIAPVSSGIETIGGAIIHSGNQAAGIYRSRGATGMERQVLGRFQPGQQWPLWRSLQWDCDRAASFACLRQQGNRG